MASEERPRPKKLGQYEIVDLIGEGAMGAVYRGWDPLIQRPVAIKTIGGAVVDDDDIAGASALARFRNEAIAAGRLQHPGIVSVFEFDVDDGTAFIAMEYVEGSTLADRIGRGEPVSDAQVSDWMAQLLDALHHAHEKGVWHRDIKPANVLITAEGRIKIADFGIARVEGRSLTAGVHLIGTPAFMAPEQFIGGEVDRRADLYSAGALMYVMLAGVPPFSGSHQQVMHRSVHEAPKPLAEISGVRRPPYFQPILTCALQKDPGQRYATAKEFREAIEQADSEHRTVVIRLPMRRPSTDAHPTVKDLPVPARDDVQRHLPAEASPFIGRASLVAEVLERLRAARLVMLLGPGGTGKTRLAVQAARHVRGVGAVWFADLAALPVGADIAPAVAHLLGVPEAGGDDLSKALAARLAEPPALLVLDNCEHVLTSAAELARAVLDGAPAARVLATSRQPLGVPAEAVLPVPPLALLPGSGPGQGPGGPPSEAAALFLARATAARPDYAAQPGSREVAERICARLDGLPLAIELAAARVKVLSGAQILARLSDMLRLLTGPADGRQPRQQTLRALCDWSWELLSERERVAFARCAVFQGEFDLEAAEAAIADEAVGAGGSLAQGDVIDAVGELVERSLVAAIERDGTMRYRLLETLRAYAAERLASAGETAALRMAHAAHYRQRAAGIAARLGGREQPAALADLGRESAQLAAALDACIETRRHDVGVPLAADLSACWHAAAIGREGLPRVERLLQAAPPASPELAMLLVRAGGLEARLFNRLDRGRELCLRGVAVAQQVRAPALVAMGQRFLGNVASRQRDPDAAVAHFEQGLDAARAAGDRGQEAMLLDNLGSVAILRSRHDDARALIGQAQALYRQLGRWVNLAGSLMNLGVIEGRLGDSARAQALLAESLEVSRAHGDVHGEAEVLVQIGLQHLEDGQAALAVPALRQAIVAAEGLDDVTLQAQHHELLARALAASADAAASRAAALQALALRRRLDTPRDVMQGLHVLAGVLVDHDAVSAARLLGHAAALRERHGLALAPDEQADVERMRERARAGAGETAHDSAWHEGRLARLDALLQQPLQSPTRQPGAATEPAR